MHQQYNPHNCNKKMHFMNLEVFDKNVYHIDIAIDVDKLRI
jgi:hypothetical protein